MSLLNLRIRGRLFGGFGALILFGLGLAGFGIFQFGQIHDQIGALTLQSNNNLRAGEIASELQAFRSAMLRYNFDQDAASYGDAEKRLCATYGEIAKNVEVLKAKRTELGGAATQMVVSRELLLRDGDMLASDLQSLSDAVGDVSALTGRIVAVQLANWKFLATRDPVGFEQFKSEVTKANQQFAEMESATTSPALTKLLASVKATFAKYVDDCEKTSTNLLLGDEIFEKGVRAQAHAAISKIEELRSAIGKTFDTTKAETEDRIVKTVTLQEIVAGATMLLGLVIAFIIARGITRPLSGLTAGMKELADGNFGIVLPGVDRKDEVGEMARAVETFKLKSEDKAREEAEAKVKQDLILAEQRKRDMRQLADDFESSVGEIIETVTSASRELETSASTLTSTAERAQELTTLVAAASEEASSNVQSVASATEEMASSVNEISRQVQESANIAQQAVDQARRTNERVGELAKAASRIGDVVDLINTIAGQTNLLALNATIEAARAGDAGRGFAVVASEVKALADQTAKATGEISQQIAGMQTATDESVGAIKEIGATIGRMSEISATIASAVEEQGAATQEISRNVQQAAQGTMQVSSNIMDVQHGAGETGTASSQVLSAAQLLARDSDRLKAEVSKFLNSVRAA
jgi:methyl-accepting chemotaxis protein